MLASIIFHVLVFLALDRMKIVFGHERAPQMVTRPVDVQRIYVQPEELQSLPPDAEIPDPTDAASLLDEVDLLEMLPDDQDLDFSTEVLDPQFAIQLQTPAIEGEIDGAALEVMSHLEIDSDLPDFGQEDTELIPAAVGQMTIDPGEISADSLDLNQFTDDLIKQGAEGRVAEGALEGITSLDDLIGLPPNTLVGKKTMLPSDLLFEFNSTELRESAKLGLMKLALLIDRNPSLYCWVEGHTDLVGGDAFNFELSRKRAEAVKRYLVDSLRMDPERILTRGFGRSQPLVTDGDSAAQSVNRRVEIRMRKTPPPAQERIVPRANATPDRAPAPVVVPEEIPRAQPAVEVDEAPPPRAVLVRPRRAEPVDEEDFEEAPRAVPVDPDELEEPLRAIPVDP